MLRLGGMVWMATPVMVLALGGCRAGVSWCRCRLSPCHLRLSLMAVPTYGTVPNTPAQYS